MGRKIKKGKNSITPGKKSSSYNTKGKKNRPAGILTICSGGNSNSLPFKFLNLTGLQRSRKGSIRGYQPFEEEERGSKNLGDHMGSDSLALRRSEQEGTNKIWGFGSLVIIEMATANTRRWDHFPAPAEW